MKRGCIIVPYRDRQEHLIEFLNHYKDVLPIYIIEQTLDKPFNRAKLLNVGFLEYGHKYDYAIYHDVDMLCESFEAYHIYPEKPLHLATACSQFHYKMPYPTYFGGVTSISTKDMITVNGYSNDFWGWGAEDDRMYNDCCSTFGSVNCIPGYRYESLPHKRKVDSNLYQKNIHLFQSPRSASDGLSSCIYEVVIRELGMIETKITVEI